MATGLKLQLASVHVLEKIQGTQNFRLTRTNPAMRLSHGAEVIWVQGGVLFDDGGTQMKDTPAWFTEEIKKVSPAALAEVGYSKRKAD